MEFVELASREFKVGFATNGKLLSVNKIKELKKARLSFLDISINSNTPWMSIDRLLTLYEIANTYGIDCRIRSVVNNAREYYRLYFLLKKVKVRWQRAMIQDPSRVRTKVCEARKKVFIILWDGTKASCCSMYNGEDPELCKHCFEIEDDIPVRYKL